MYRTVRFGFMNDHSQIKEKLAELNKEARRGDDEAQIPVGVVRTKAFKRRARKYFRYVGSLTTPPCTENVIWIILGKVIYEHSEKLENFHKIGVCFLFLQFLNYHSMSRFLKLTISSAR